MVRTVPVHPGDEAFLFRLFASTRQEELAAAGWDHGQQEAFLRMQFQLQSRAYAFRFPDADDRLILQGDQPIGRILVDRSADAIHLVDIALLPECCGGGIGTGLLTELQAEAARAGKLLSLQVLSHSPARRLYARLGFATSADQGVYCSMEWRSS